MSDTTHQICVDCNKQSPMTNSSFTLIGGNWRFTRTFTADKKLIIAWHCPECWAASQKVAAAR